MPIDYSSQPDYDPFDAVITVNCTTDSACSSAHIKQLARHIAEFAERPPPPTRWVRTFRNTERERFDDSICGHSKHYTERRCHHSLTGRLQNAYASTWFKCFAGKTSAVHQQTTRPMCDLRCGRPICLFIVHVNRQNYASVISIY
jgi:hypothetical protein